MKTLFFEHKKQTVLEYQDLWNNCLFVFDTNVLLNLYRYSSLTFLELKEAFDNYQNRIWIPNQVAVEFFRNRLNVINEQRRSYIEPTKYLNKLQENFKSKKGHPFISQDLLLQFNEISERVIREFTEQDKLLGEYINNDTILNTIFELFDSRTGKSYSSEELIKLYSEAKNRYALNIPPGYRDINKPEPERYSDFIIWKQLIDKASVDKISIILISDDEKEDWIEINSNQKLGPRPQLIKEFRESTGQSFYIYPAFQFLKLAYEDRNKKVDQPAIDEIKELTSTILSSKSIKDFDYYSISVVLNTNGQPEDKFDLFCNVLQNQGYAIVAKNVSKDNIYSISLTVPFEDLIRRFQKILSELASNYSYTIITYDYSKP